MFDREMSQFRNHPDIGGPNSDALERGLMRLRATMAAHPLRPIETDAWWSQPFGWKPATLLLLALVVGGTGYAVAGGASTLGQVFQHRASPVQAATNTEQALIGPLAVGALVEHGLESERESEAEHVDVEPPEIRIPSNHQPRHLALREAARSAEKFENKIKAASTR